MDRFAFYSLLIVIVYVIGLPLVVFVILYRRRHKLFGDTADPFVATTRSTYGFLYEVRPCIGCIFIRRITLPTCRGYLVSTSDSATGLLCTVADCVQVYGPSAWWWEVEELIRKLLLSAVVVLIESGSPLQVRFGGTTTMS